LGEKKTWGAEATFVNKWDETNGLSVIRQIEAGGDQNVGEGLNWRGDASNYPQERASLKGWGQRGLRSG